MSNLNLSCIHQRFKMDVFKRMILMGLLISANISMSWGHFSRGAPDFHIEPKRIVIHPLGGGGTITVYAHSSGPLRSCMFVLPSAQALDFSLGRNSPKTGKYSYHGRGLQAGDCGLTLTSYHPDLVDLAGVIEGRVRRVGSEAWESNVATIRVTGLAAKHLPVFEISPKKAELRKGDNLTITCNAKKTIEFCHFFLPGGRNLTFDLGPMSKSTPEYRYHGAGLQRGACGVTLIGVQENLSGHVVCKLGRLPANEDGIWNIDAVKVRVLAPQEASTGRPPGVSTAARPVTTAATTPRAVVSTLPVPSAVTSPSTASSTPVPVPTPECGKASPRTVNIVPLINFGEQTYRGQWPWHVALYRRTPGGTMTYVCGGTLISLNTVVTAGHCITAGNRAVNASTVMVYAGKYYLDLAREGTELQQRNVRRIVLHNEYNLSAGLLNDIAMLILETSFMSTSFVKPVCLWDPSNTTISSVVERGGTVVGWGVDETGQLTEELMMATMPVVSYETCVESNPQHFSVYTRRTTFCAGFRNGTSACNGDSGGGMVFPTQRGAELTWHLRGVVSNSLKKENELVCDPLNYVVFTDVAQYLNWIATNRLST